MVPISREKFPTPCVKSNMFKCFSGLWYQISYLIEMVIELTYIVRLWYFIKMGHYLGVVKVISNIFRKVSHATTIMRCRVHSRNHFSNTWMPIRDNSQLISIIYKASHILKKLFIWGITSLVHDTESHWKLKHSRHLVPPPIAELLHTCSLDMCHQRLVLFSFLENQLSKKHMIQRSTGTFHFYRATMPSCILDWQLQAYTDTH